MATPQTQTIRMRPLTIPGHPGTASIQLQPEPTLASSKIVTSNTSATTATPLSTVTKLLPPTGQFIINTLLQIAGFIAAIAFGIYAVQSVAVSKDGNQSSELANQLSLLDFCLSNNNGQTEPIASICSRVVFHASTMIPSVASSLFSNLPTVSTSSSASDSGSATSTASSSAAPTPGAKSSSALGGIIAGVVVGVFLVIGIFAFFCVSTRKKRRTGHAYYPTAYSAPAEVSYGAPHSQAPQQRQESRSVAQRLREFFVETRLVTDARGD